MLRTPGAHWFRVSSLFWNAIASCLSTQKYQGIFLLSLESQKDVILVKSELQSCLLQRQLLLLWTSSSSPLKAHALSLAWKTQICFQVFISTLRPYTFNTEINTKLELSPCCQQMPLFQERCGCILCQKRKNLY